MCDMYLDMFLLDKTRIGKHIIFEMVRSWVLINFFNSYFNWLVFDLSHLNFSQQHNLIWTESKHRRRFTWLNQPYRCAEFMLEKN